MATHSPQDLFTLWKQEQLPVEMATGHILQNLVIIQDALDTIKRELAQLRMYKPDATTPSSKSNPASISKRKPHKS